MAVFSIVCFWVALGRISVFIQRRYLCKPWFPDRTMAANLWDRRYYAGDIVSSVERQADSYVCVIHDTVQCIGVSGRMVSGIDLGSQMVGLQPCTLESAWQDLSVQQSPVWPGRNDACVADQSAVLFSVSKDPAKDSDRSRDARTGAVCGRCGLQRHKAACGSGDNISEFNNGI